MENKILQKVNTIFTVSGKIVNSNGIPVSGLRVAAYIKSIKADLLIGTSATDDSGVYSIKIAGKYLQENSSPDVEVRGYRTREKNVLARSAIIYNLRKNEVVNLVIPADMMKYMSEYENLLRDIKKHTGTLDLSKLRETKEESQITYLANKTGWDARLVAMLVSACKSGQELRVDPTHLYAMFRFGVQGNAEDIKSMSAAAIRSVVARALKKNIIPSGTSVEETIKLLDSGANDLILNRPSGFSGKTLSNMLDLHGLNDNQKYAFARVFYEAENDPDKLWSGLAGAGFDGEMIKRFRLDGKLGYLTGHNIPLINKLYKKYDISQDIDLVKNGFYKASAWKDLIDPGDIPGKIKPEDYASHLAGQVRLSYPTAVAGQMILNEEIKLGEKVPRELLHRFFMANNSSFTIGRHPVKGWKGFGKLTNLAKEFALKLERLYQVSPTDEAMIKLDAAGLSSACEIASYTKDDFLTKYENCFSGKAEALQTYTKAREVYSIVLGIATGYVTQRSMPNLFAISGRNCKVSEKVNRQPTLENLFGNMDYCSCEHCNSVLSPAAYLVDILQFIDIESAETTVINPIKTLFSRRPDIQNIQLSCENTNLEIPYVDLVNEILEYFLVNNNLEGLMGHDMNEATKQEDLLAEPQYVTEAAYDELKKEVFPYNLPFDQPLEMLRRLFGLWDYSLEEALEVFSDPLSSRKEALNLNSEEYKTLTDITFKSLPAYFGEEEPNPLSNPFISKLNDAIADGKTFCRRVDITYEELIRLLKTNFINPGFELNPLLLKLNVSLKDINDFYTGVLTKAQFDALLPVGLDESEYGGSINQWLQDNNDLLMGLITLTRTGSGTGDCDFATVELRYSLPDMNKNSLTEISYHKFHRFLRLMKKTGWQIETLDKIIRIFLDTLSQDLTVGNIDSAFVILLDRIANFKKIAGHFNLTEKKFGGVLMIFDSEVEQSLREEACAKLLKIKTEEMKELSLLIGIDPLKIDLESADPSLLRFIRITERLKSLSLKTADLAYLLHHRDDSKKMTIPEDALLKYLKLLKDTLTTVERENAIDPQAADFAQVKSKMALVYDGSVVENFFGLLTRSKTYIADFYSAIEALPEKITNIDPDISFDAYKKQLLYKGILLDIAKEALEKVVDPSEPDPLVPSDLWQSATQSDLDKFALDYKEAIQLISDSGKKDLDKLTADYTELKDIFDEVSKEDDPAVKAQILVNKILPELKSKLRLTGLRQALCGILNTSQDVVNVLTGRPEVLHSAGSDTTKGVLFDFEMLEDKNQFKINGAHKFYLDIPATDDYLLYVSAPEKTKVTVAVDSKDIINGVVSASGLLNNSTRLALKGGVLHYVEMKLDYPPATTSSDNALLMWGSKGMARTVIPDSAIFRYEKVDIAKKSLTRLSKSVQLQKLFKLTPDELDYFASTDKDIKNILNDLPVEDKGASTLALLPALWQKAEWLAFFASMKKANEPEENTWLSILKDPMLKNSQGKYLIDSINNWTESDTDKILDNFGFKQPSATDPPARSNLSSLPVLSRVMEAMQMVMAVGYPASDLINLSTGNPSFSMVTDIKSKIKANVTEEAWYESIRVVSDQVRNLLRDALVNYIIYHCELSSEIDTANKLYEYFLVDVAMDASMMTSRIKLAISSVQLFIQRCQMNLETEVSPTSIRNEQWIWMKRYRLWEAGRKVFLFPQDYLEPELRDNKSSFFKDLEGELMQHEITDESAELAFLNYLKKLDDISTLEIVCTYLEENDLNNQDDDILHVIGRTNGKTRQYYYRIFKGGSWYPWGKINLTIEGDHIIPVVWKKRFYIFWLSILDKSAVQDKEESVATIANDKALGDIATKEVEITVCWGEYYKEKWTSPKSSELRKPLKLSGLTEFDPENLNIFLRKEIVQNPIGKFREWLVFFVFYDLDPEENLNKFFNSELPKVSETFSGNYLTEIKQVVNENMVRVNAGEVSFHGITDTMQSRVPYFPASKKVKKGRITFTSKNIPPYIEYASDSQILEKICNYYWNLYIGAYLSRLWQTFPFLTNRLVLHNKSFIVNIAQPANAVGTSNSFSAETILTKNFRLNNDFSICYPHHIIENKWEEPVFYADEHSTFYIQPEQKTFVHLPEINSYFPIHIIEAAEVVHIPPIIEKPVSEWPPKIRKNSEIAEIANPWKLLDYKREVNSNLSKVLSASANFTFGSLNFNSYGRI